MDDLSCKEIAISQPFPELSLVHSSGQSLSAKYHDSEIDNNNKIIKAAVRMLWAGIVVIAFGIIFAIYEKTSSAQLTCISGVIMEFISGAVFGVVGVSTRSKQKYYTQLAKAEERERLLQEINSCQNQKTREKLLEKLVDNYCSKS